MASARGVADLHGQPALGPVQHGLAVKADDIDVLKGNTMLSDEGGHGFGMGRGDDAFGLPQAARPGIALRQVDRLIQRLTQQFALGFGIGPVSGRPEGGHPAAVGFDQGDVHPVERGATHQTNCRQHHRGAFATPCSIRPADDDQLVPNTQFL